MKVLLTGSSGFIGSHILSSLKKSYTVLAPSHKELDLLQEDMVRKYFKKNRIDIVIHCAVIGGNGPRLQVKGMFYDNVRIFFNIAGCKKYYKRLINIGSGAVYDKRLPIVEIKEDGLGKSIPTDEYGLYKFLCATYINGTDNMVDLRVFGIFGEGEEYRQRFISNALCRLIYGLPITIKQNVFFDYLDIRDFVRIVEYFIRHKSKYKAYNIGSGKKIDLISIAREIIALFGHTQYPIVVGRQRFGNEYSGDTKRLYSELTRFRPTPLAESLRRLYAWYQQNKKNIQKEELL